MTVLTTCTICRLRSQVITSRHGNFLEGDFGGRLVVARAFIARNPRRTLRVNTTPLLATEPSKYCATTNLLRQESDASGAIHQITCV